MVSTGELAVLTWPLLCVLCQLNMQLQARSRAVDNSIDWTASFQFLKIDQSLDNHIPCALSSLTPLQLGPTPLRPCRCWLMPPYL